MFLTDERKRKLSFFSVLFTFFVDNLGWSIVFPIFAPLFLDVQHSIFPAELSVTYRTVIYGCFVAIYPLAQFFGAPILGELADVYGRKKVFSVSVFLTCIGYILSAISINRSLSLLFFSRVVTGVFSGNLSICLATLSDLSKDEKARIKNFGYLSVLAGFSFIIGAFLGGKLSDSSLSSYFRFDTPFWFAAILCFVNLLFILFAFYETYFIHKNIKFDFLESIHNIQKALKTKRIKSIYLIYFLFVFSWTILFQFTPILVIRKFAFTNSSIGDLAAFMGICWAVGSGVINKILIKRFSSIKILEVSLILFTSLCGMVAFPNNIVGVLIILCFCVIIGGMAWPLCANLISSLAPDRMQGKIMGISQSMQSLAMAISPIIGSLVDQIHMSVTFVLAAFASLIAATIYLIKKKI